MSEPFDTKTVGQILMVMKARAEAAEAEVERLKGVLVEQVKQYPDYSDICRKALGGDAS